MLNSDSTTVSPLPPGTLAQFSISDPLGNNSNGIVGAGAGGSAGGSGGGSGSAVGVHGLSSTQPSDFNDEPTPRRLFRLGSTTLVAPLTTGEIEGGDGVSNGGVVGGSGISSFSPPTSAGLTRRTNRRASLFGNTPFMGEVIAELDDVHGMTPSGSHAGSVNTSRMDLMSRSSSFTTPLTTSVISGIPASSSIAQRRRSATYRTFSLRQGLIVLVLAVLIYVAQLYFVTKLAEVTEK